MKKTILSVLAAALLCLLSLAAMVYAHGQLTNRGEDVAVTETTLFGDQKEAEGIETVSAFRYGLLTWRISCSPAETLMAETDVSYNDNISLPDHRAYGSADIDIDIDIHSQTSSSSYGIDLKSDSLTDDSAAPSLRQILLDLAAETAPGKTTKRTMSLDALMDYLPVKLYCHPKQSYKSESDLGVFALPVPDDPVTITVGKNDDGEVTSYGLEFDQGLYLQSYILVDDDYCYVILTDVTAEDETAGGTRKVSSLPEDQRGIYRLPLDDAKALGASQFLNDDDRFLFYPIGKDAQVLELEEDDMYFLLYTIEDSEDGESKSVYLSFIDKDTGRLADKLLLRGVSDTAHTQVLAVCQSENFCLTVLSGGDFFLLERKGSSYKPSFSGRLSAFDQFEDLDFSTVQACFDGQKLAVFFSVNDREDELGRLRHKGCCLQVFDQTGLKYAGLYTNSLQALQDQSDMTYLINSADSVSFSTTGGQTANGEASNEEAAKEEASK